MKLYLKFDFNTIAKIHLDTLLNESNLKYKNIGFGEIELLEAVSDEAFTNLNLKLNSNGIEIIENQKSIFVQKVKDLIIEMVQNPENVNVKSSIYLSEKMNYNYSYISNLFSEVTYTSIENFIILQKIELAKQLIIANELTLTEIAFNLNYSSVAHLSTQFKNTTGITPSAFQRIIIKRKELANKK
ncbi:AraC family transcriptional regulator [Flavobacterium sp. SUN052]|uniref:helix-turn-helix domain-containing protein n=1 Tax=Flavobacterium sp. SUN052 TaxID=3002441 RepID=UPI00237E6B80|nr:AraC family transcriptional regulator [Flavobacterium sp. SUN052]MEC4005725.1 AraC family transcriptional regulator [Flavobacterium sp. SUN052]